MMKLVMMLCIILLILQIIQNIYYSHKEPYCSVDGDCKPGLRCQKSSFGTGEGFCV